jgi:hypothetical protein
MPERYRATLPVAVSDLWRRLEPYDQHHLIAVACDLEASGEPDAVVLAGLLHDIGKAGRIALPHRVAHVLLGRLAPSVADRWRASSARVPGCDGLHLLLRHAANGAALLAAAGMSDEIIWLVEYHEERLDHPGLNALRAADRRH